MVSTDDIIVGMAIGFIVYMFILLLEKFIKQSLNTGQFLGKTIETGLIFTKESASKTFKFSFNLILSVIMLILVYFYLSANGILQ